MSRLCKIPAIRVLCPYPSRSDLLYFSDVFLFKNRKEQLFIPSSSALIHQGKVLWMGGRRIPKMRSALETEMEAMRWAVLSLTRFSYKNVIFETDSKTVAEVIREENQWPMVNGVIQDIQDLLSRFGPYSVIFSPRETNGVADRIAKETISFLNYVPKLYTVLPIWISPSVEADMRRDVNNLVL